MTRATPSADVTTQHPRLHLAFELSNTTWKLGFAVSRAGKIRERNVASGDIAAVIYESQAAKKHFRLPPETPVVACYEAGRDGFWLQRGLEARGFDCSVVDPASILVDRRMRHAKTDRLDVKALMRLLVRYAEGERDVWRVVKVPPSSAEDLRSLSRERATLVKEQTMHVNRAKSLLARAGIKPTSITPALEAQLPALRGPAGEGLGPHAQDEVRRELARLRLVKDQIKEIEKTRDRLLEQAQAAEQQRTRTSTDTAQTRKQFQDGGRIAETAQRLTELKGIGATSAYVLSAEFFGWREFRNRKQVAALAGLTPTPWQSGDMDREQGISKAGNPRIRSLAIQLAWGWTRFQPRSALTQEFQERTETGGKRQRRKSIVALARKLLIALWRYLEQGLIPAGAQLSKA